MSSRVPIPVDEDDIEVMSMAYTKMKSAQQAMEVHASVFEKARGLVARRLNKMATEAGVDPNEYALNLTTKRFEPLDEVSPGETRQLTGGASQLLLSDVAVEK